MANKINTITSVLGKPYFQNDKTILYCGDSLKLMEQIKQKSDILKIDLTVTSPPYNIGKEYEHIKPVEQYISWSNKWMNLVYSITKKDGSFWLNIGYMPIKNKGKAVPIAYLLWDKSKFYFMQEIVWHYEAGVAAKKSLSPRNEKVLWFVKDEHNYTFNLDAIRDPNVKYPNQKKNGRLKVNILGKNPSDVWNIPKVTSGRNRSSKERVNHPAQTPVELFKRVILAGSNTNDIILDPFVGSGTTNVAAQSLNRFSIGIDNNKEYLDLAIERLNTERIQQQALF